MNCKITILCIWTLWNVLVNGLIVTYKELQQLGVGCYPEDSCLEPRTEDSPGISWSHSCSCNRLCSQFDTCCVDSYYNSIKPSTIRPSCRNVNLTHSSTAYFIVDRCTPGVNGEPSAWEKLCNEESAEDDDLMRLVPVTSHFTFMTYKNYFCFRCHETTNDYSNWKLWLVGASSQYLQPGLGHTLQYNKNKKTWTVTFSDKNVSISVDLKLDIPSEIWSLPVECVADVVSDCNPDWHDGSVRENCRAYTAIVVVKRNKTFLKYKNPHCALCNFESLENIICKTDFSGLEEDLDEDIDGGIFPFFPNSKDFGSVKTENKKFFSFTDFMNIQEEAKVDEIKCKENFIWDPYRKRCRPLVCALPYHVVINSKCVPI